MLKALSFALVMICIAGTARAETNGGLASPMVDRSIYKPDAIQRLAGRFENWTVVCDEIAALKRRFCSLGSRTGRDAYGQAVRIDVSTGDDGRPAALLHLPLRISIAAGLDVRIGGAKARGGRRIGIATCNDRECLAVWSLEPAALQALTAGGSIDLSYCSLRPGLLEFSPDLHRKSCEARLASNLSGAGFHAAVIAATHE